MVVDLDAFAGKSSSCLLMVALPHFRVFQSYFLQVLTVWPQDLLPELLCLCPFCSMYSGISSAIPSLPTDLPDTTCLSSLLHGSHVLKEDFHILVLYPPPGFYLRSFSDCYVSFSFPFVGKLKSQVSNPRGHLPPYPLQDNVYKGFFE